MNYSIIKALICAKAQDFGFSEARIAKLELPQQAQQKFAQWLQAGYGGDMQYLSNNQHLRFDPEQLVPGSLSVICVKAPYLTKPLSYHKQRLTDPNHGYISSYAVGRDYHKVVKQQLKLFAQWIERELLPPEFNHAYRVFTDSAPIMEVELHAATGNGWRGKNTLLLNKQQGSMFFLGELFTNLPLEPDSTTSSHCGSCSRCLTSCPTQAFTAPYILDARRCIAYLTIENKGPIPLEMRPLIGNRVYGCDDCQLVCPWNKFSQITRLLDFNPRHNLDNSSLLELFKWDEAQFTAKLQGSPIYRIGYQAWQRNLAVGLGNAPYHPAIIAALSAKLPTASAMVAEHIQWALLSQQQKQATES